MSRRNSSSEISQRVVSILTMFARDDTVLEEIEYTAELLIAIAEEDDATVQDRSKLVTEFTQVLEETEFLDRNTHLSTVIEQIGSILYQGDNQKDQTNGMSKRRRLRKERRETQYAIGKTCLVVLEENNMWHPARIIKHLDENEDESTVDADCAMEMEIEFVEFGKKQIVREDKMVMDEDVAGRKEAEDMTGLCKMCERPMNLTAHHLTPRATHSKYLRKGYSKEFLNTCIIICRQCHSKIHSLEDNRTLAREYNTLDKIMLHPQIITWIAYARKQKARIKPRKQTKWPLSK